MNDTELNKLFIDWFYWTIECIGDETNNTKFQRVKDNFKLPEKIHKGNIFGNKEEVSLYELPLPILSGFVMLTFVMYTHEGSITDFSEDESPQILVDSVKDLYERHLKRPLRKFCGRNGIPQLDLDNLQYFIKIKNGRSQL